MRMTYCKLNQNQVIEKVDTFEYIFGKKAEKPVGLGDYNGILYAQIDDLLEGNIVEKEITAKRKDKEEKIKVEVFSKEELIRKINNRRSTHLILNKEIVKAFGPNIKTNNVNRLLKYEDYIFVPIEYFLPISKDKDDAQRVNEFINRYSALLEYSNNIYDRLIDAIKAIDIKGRDIEGSKQLMRSLLTTGSIDVLVKDKNGTKSYMALGGKREIPISTNNTNNLLYKYLDSISGMAKNFSVVVSIKLVGLDVKYEVRRGKAYSNNSIPFNEHYSRYKDVYDDIIRFNIIDVVFNKLKTLDNVEEKDKKVIDALFDRYDAIVKKHKNLYGMLQAMKRDTDLKEEVFDINKSLFRLLHHLSIKDNTSPHKGIIFFMGRLFDKSTTDGTLINNIDGSISRAVYDKISSDLKSKDAILSELDEDALDVWSQVIDNLSEESNLLTVIEDLTDNNIEVSAEQNASLEEGVQDADESQDGEDSYLLGDKIDPITYVQKTPKIIEILLSSIVPDAKGTYKKFKTSMIYFNSKSDGSEVKRIISSFNDNKDLYELDDKNNEIKFKGGIEEASTYDAYILMLISFEPSLIGKEIPSYFVSVINDLVITEKMVLTNNMVVNNDNVYGGVSLFNMSINKFKYESRYNSADMGFFKIAEMLKAYVLLKRYVSDEKKDKKKLNKAMKLFVENSGISDDAKEYLKNSYVIRAFGDRFAEDIISYFEEVYFKQIALLEDKLKNTKAIKPYSFSNMSYVWNVGKADPEDAPLVLKYNRGDLPNIPFISPYVAGPMLRIDMKALERAINATTDEEAQDKVDLEVIYITKYVRGNKDNNGLPLAVKRVFRPAELSKDKGKIVKRTTKELNAFLAISTEHGLTHADSMFVAIKDTQVNASVKDVMSPLRHTFSAPLYLFSSLFLGMTNSMVKYSVNSGSLYDHSGSFMSNAKKVNEGTAKLPYVGATSALSHYYDFMPIYVRGSLKDNKSHAKSPTIIKMSNSLFAFLDGFTIDVSAIADGGSQPSLGMTPKDMKYIFASTNTDLDSDVGFVNKMVSLRNIRFSDTLQHINIANMRVNTLKNMVNAASMRDSKGMFNYGVYGDSFRIGLSYLNSNPLDKTINNIQIDKKSVSYFYMTQRGKVLEGENLNQYNDVLKMLQEDIYLNNYLNGLSDSLLKDISTDIYYHLNLLLKQSGKKYIAAILNKTYYNNNRFNNSAIFRIDDKEEGSVDKKEKAKSAYLLVFLQAMFMLREMFGKDYLPVLKKFASEYKLVGEDTTLLDYVKQKYEDKINNIGLNEAEDIDDEKYSVLEKLLINDNNDSDKSKAHSAMTKGSILVSKVMTGSLLFESVFDGIHKGSTFEEMVVNEGMLLEVFTQMLLHADTINAVFNALFGTKDENRTIKIDKVNKVIVGRLGDMSFTIKVDNVKQLATTLKDIFVPLISLLPLLPNDREVMSAMKVQGEEDYDRFINAFNTFINMATMINMATYDGSKLDMEVLKTHIDNYYTRISPYVENMLFKHYFDNVNLLRGLDKQPNTIASNISISLLSSAAKRIDNIAAYANNVMTIDKVKEITDRLGDHFLWETDIPNMKKIQNKYIVEHQIRFKPTYYNRLLLYYMLDGRRKDVIGKFGATPGDFIFSTYASDYEYGDDMYPSLGIANKSIENTKTQQDILPYLRHLLFLNVAFNDAMLSLYDDFGIDTYYTKGDDVGKRGKLAMTTGASASLNKTGVEAFSSFISKLANNNNKERIEYLRSISMADSLNVVVISDPIFDTTKGNPLMPSIKETTEVEAINGQTYITLEGLIYLWFAQGMLDGIKMKLAKEYIEKGEISEELETELYNLGYTIIDTNKTLYSGSIDNASIRTPNILKHSSIVIFRGMGKRSFVDTSSFVDRLYDYMIKNKIFMISPESAAKMAGVKGKANDSLVSLKVNDEKKVVDIVFNEPSDTKNNIGITSISKQDLIHVAHSSKGIKDAVPVNIKYLLFTWVYTEMYDGVTYDGQPIIRNTIDNMLDTLNIKVEDRDKVRAEIANIYSKILSNTIESVSDYNKYLIDSVGKALGIDSTNIKNFYDSLNDIVNILIKKNPEVETIIRKFATNGVPLMLSSDINQLINSLKNSFDDVRKVPGNNLIYNAPLSYFPMPNYSEKVVSIRTQNINTGIDINKHVIFDDKNTINDKTKKVNINGYINYVDDLFTIKDKVDAFLKTLELKESKDLTKEQIEKKKADAAVSLAKAIKYVSDILGLDERLKEHLSSIHTSIIKQIGSNIDDVENIIKDNRKLLDGLKVVTTSKKKGISFKRMPIDNMFGSIMEKAKSMEVGDYLAYADTIGFDIRDSRTKKLIFYRASNEDYVLLSDSEEDLDTLTKEIGKADDKHPLKKAKVHLLKYMAMDINIERKKGIRDTVYFTDFSNILDIRIYLDPDTIANIKNNKNIKSIVFRTDEVDEEALKKVITTIEEEPAKQEKEVSEEGDEMSDIEFADSILRETDKIYGVMVARDKKGGLFPIMLETTTLPLDLERDDPDKVEARKRKDMAKTFYRFTEGKEVFYNAVALTLAYADNKDLSDAIFQDTNNQIPDLKDKKVEFINHQLSTYIGNYDGMSKELKDILSSYDIKDADSLASTYKLIIDFLSRKAWDMIQAASTPEEKEKLAKELSQYIERLTKMVEERVSGETFITSVLNMPVSLMMDREVATLFFFLKGVLYYKKKPEKRLIDTDIFRRRMHSERVNLSDMKVIPPDVGPIKDNKVYLLSPMRAGMSLLKTHYFVLMKSYDGFTPINITRLNFMLMFGEHNNTIESEESLSLLRENGIVKDGDEWRIDGDIFSKERIMAIKEMILKDMTFVNIRVPLQTPSSIVIMQPLYIFPKSYTGNMEASPYVLVKQGADLDFDKATIYSKAADIYVDEKRAVKEIKKHFKGKVASKEMKAFADELLKAIRKYTDTKKGSFSDLSLLTNVILRYGKIIEVTQVQEGDQVKTKEQFKEIDERTAKQWAMSIVSALSYKGIMKADDKPYRVTNKMVEMVSENMSIPSVSSNNPVTTSKMFEVIKNMTPKRDISTNAGAITRNLNNTETKSLVSYVGIAVFLQNLAAVERHRNAAYMALLDKFVSQTVDATKDSTALEVLETLDGSLSLGFIYFVMQFKNMYNMAAAPRLTNTILEHIRDIFASMLEVYDANRNTIDKVLGVKRENGNIINTNEIGGAVVKLVEDIAKHKITQDRNDAFMDKLKEFSNNMNNPVFVDYFSGVFGAWYIDFRKNTKGAINPFIYLSQKLQFDKEFTNKGHFDDSMLDHFVELGIIKEKAKGITKWKTTIEIGKKDSSEKSAVMNKSFADLLKETGDSESKAFYALTAIRLYQNVRKISHDELWFVVSAVPRAILKTEDIVRVAEKFKVPYETMVSILVLYRKLLEAYDSSKNQSVGKNLIIDRNKFNSSPELYRDILLGAIHTTVYNYMYLISNEYRFENFTAGDLRVSDVVGQGFTMSHYFTASLVKYVTKGINDIATMRDVFKDIDFFRGFFVSLLHQMSIYNMVSEVESKGTRIYMLTYDVDTKASIMKEMTQINPYYSLLFSAAKRAGADIVTDVKTIEVKDKDGNINEIKRVTIYFNKMDLKSFMMDSIFKNSSPFAIMSMAISSAINIADNLAKAEEKEAALKAIKPLMDMSKDHWADLSSMMNSNDKMVTYSLNDTMYDYLKKAIDAYYEMIGKKGSLAHNVMIKNLEKIDGLLHVFTDPERSMILDNDKSASELELIKEEVAKIREKAKVFLSGRSNQDKDNVINALAYIMYQGFIFGVINNIRRDVSAIRYQSMSKSRNISLSLFPEVVSALSDSAMFSKDKRATSFNPLSPIIRYYVSEKELKVEEGKDKGKEKSDKKAEPQKVSIKRIGSLLEDLLFGDEDKAISEGITTASKEYSNILPYVLFGKIPVKAPAKSSIEHYSSLIAYNIATASTFALREGHIKMLEMIKSEDRRTIASSIYGGIIDNSVFRYKMHGIPRFMSNIYTGINEYSKKDIYAHIPQNVKDEVEMAKSMLSFTNKAYTAYIDFVLKMVDVMYGRVDTAVLNRFTLRTDPLVVSLLSSKEAFSLFLRISDMNKIAGEDYEKALLAAKHFKTNRTKGKEAVESITMFDVFKEIGFLLDDMLKAETIDSYADGKFKLKLGKSHKERDVVYVQDVLKTSLFEHLNITNADYLRDTVIAVKEILGVSDANSVVKIGENNREAIKEITDIIKILMNNGQYDGYTIKYKLDKLKSTSNKGLVAKLMSQLPFYFMMRMMSDIAEVDTRKVTGIEDVLKDIEAITNENEDIKVLENLYVIITNLNRNSIEAIRERIDNKLDRSANDVMMAFFNYLLFRSTLLVTGVYKSWMSPVVKDKGILVKREDGYTDIYITDPKLYYDFDAFTSIYYSNLGMSYLNMNLLYKEYKDYVENNPLYIYSEMEDKYISLINTINSINFADIEDRMKPVIVNSILSNVDLLFGSYYSKLMFPFNSKLDTESGTSIAKGDSLIENNMGTEEQYRKQTWIIDMMSNGIKEALEKSNIDEQSKAVIVQKVESYNQQNNKKCQ